MARNGNQTNEENKYEKEKKVGKHQFGMSVSVCRLCICNVYTVVAFAMKSIDKYGSVGNVD